MKRIRLVLLAVFLLWRSVIGASVPECVFEHYSSLDGLPHNSISDICRDSRGFVWICTWYGLSRFDGYTFKNYKTLPGDYSPLSHNRFLSVTEDVFGYLWLTTYDHRLYRFDRYRERFDDIPGSYDGFASGDYKVERFLCSSRGEVWIALSGTGLICAVQHGEDERIDIVDYSSGPLIGRHISFLFEDDMGRIVVVSERGIVLLTARANSHEYEPLVLSTESAVYDWAETDDRLCFGLDGKVLLIDKRTSEGYQVCPSVGQCLLGTFHGVASGINHRSLEGFPIGGFEFRGHDGCIVPVSFRDVDVGNANLIEDAG